MEMESTTNSRSPERVPPRIPDWHLVFIIYASKDIVSDSGGVLAQEGVYLIKAKTARVAYDEAVKWASPRQTVVSAGSKSVMLPFAGITEIMPVWEPFEHGNELGFRNGQYESWDAIADEMMSKDDLH